MGDGGDQIVEVLKLHTIENKLSFHHLANEIMKKSEINFVMRCLQVDDIVAHYHKKKSKKQKLYYINKNMYKQ